MRHTRIVTCAALIATAVLSGCRGDDPGTATASNPASGSQSSHRAAELNLPSGTPIEVTLNTRLSSETASIGDAWSGSVRNASVVDGRSVVPAGSSASGTVSGVTAAHKGNRAMLDLQLTSISVGEHHYTVRGGTESVIAGSPRARNLGAIAASTVAGGIIGHAVGGNTKGTVIGGLIGGGVATGVVAKSSGYQVVLKEGTPLTFTTSEAVAVRR